METTKHDNKELTEENLEKIAGGTLGTRIYRSSSSGQSPHRNPVSHRSSSTTESVSRW